MSAKSGRRRIDPIWFAPVLILVVAGLAAVAVTMYAGGFRSFVPITVVSDRAGLVMEPGAKVKLRGVEVGEVNSLGLSLDSAKLDVNLFADSVHEIPSNVQAQISASTVFGAKYVDLIAPDDPSHIAIAAGAVVPSHNVTVEVNTVFENLQAVVKAIDPAKLNAILTAFSESVQGKADAIGRAITDSNNVLLAVNPRMSAVRADIQALGRTADIYSAAAVDVLAILAGTTTSATTINNHAADIDTMLISAAGFGHTGFDVIGSNLPNLVRSLDVAEPTTDLLVKYSPTYACMLMGAQWALDNSIGSLGGNGRTAVVDSGTLFGDDAYKYPQHLPKINATGGPDGKPSCGSLPDVSANWPVRYMVTDTGFGTNPKDIRTGVGLGHPWYVNFFPETRNPPQPPSYRGQR